MGNWPKLRTIASAIASQEDAIVLLAGILAYGAVSAGGCGLALWLMPTAPPWAVKSVFLGGALAVFCLVLLTISAQVPKVGIMGILKRRDRGGE